MEALKRTMLDGRDVILTDDGRSSYCMFATEADARSDDPDAVAIGTVGRRNLTDGQVADAEHNSAILAEAG